MGHELLFADGRSDEVGADIGHFCHRDKVDEVEARRGQSLRRGHGQEKDFRNEGEEQHAVGEAEKGRGDLVEAPEALERFGHAEEHHQDHERGDGEPVEFAIPVHLISPVGSEEHGEVGDRDDKSRYLKSAEPVIGEEPEVFRESSERENREETEKDPGL